MNWDVHLHFGRCASLSSFWAGPLGMGFCDPCLGYFWCCCWATHSYVTCHEVSGGLLGSPRPAICMPCWLCIGFMFDSGMLRYTLHTCASTACSHCSIYNIYCKNTTGITTSYTPAVQEALQFLCTIQFTHNWVIWSMCDNCYIDLVYCSHLTHIALPVNDQILTPQLW